MGFCLQRRGEWSGPWATSAFGPFFLTVDLVRIVMSSCLELICDSPLVPWSSRWHDGAGRADSRHPHLRHLQAAVQQPGRLRSSQAERLPSDRRVWGGPRHRPVCVGGNSARRPDSDHHQNHHLGDADDHRYDGGRGRRLTLAVSQTPPHIQLAKNIDSQGLPARVADSLFLTSSTGKPASWPGLGTAGLKR